MPKSQYIDPTQMRKPGEITFTPIPVNQYNKTVKDELKAKHFTKDDLKRIYRDMVVIREFETMLQLVKTTGGYNGVEYNNPGPAHLSAGQEAAAVGMAYMLDINDFIFGSHRSHGEILAKGLRAIELLDDKSLEKIMNEFWDGATVNVAKKAFKGGTTKELGIRFLLYGALAEVFARTTGFNKGLGGSMHTFFTPFGIYPNNAIVGGSGTIAMGAALPLGVGAAVYITEYAENPRVVRLISFAAETLTGIPSILFGLIGMLFFIKLGDLRQGVLAGGLTLALMVLPTVMANTRESLLAVPRAYREGALALGSGKWHMVRTVVLPNAVDGIVTGCILSYRRGR